MKVFIMLNGIDPEASEVLSSKEELSSPDRTIIDVEELKATLAALKTMYDIYASLTSLCVQSKRAMLESVALLNLRGASHYDYIAKKADNLSLSLSHSHMNEGSLSLEKRYEIICHKIQHLLQRDS